MAFNFPDGASNGDTHTASNGTIYRYNGTTWVVDSASTTTNFDTRYLNSNGDGVISGSSQIDGFVSSSSANIIEVMTSASYAAITPVSGTLYIIQG